MMVTIQSEQQPDFFDRSVEMSQDVGAKIATKLHLKKSNNTELVSMDRITRTNVQLFLHTIGKYKSEIIELYGSDPQEYNLLAQIAFGILGNESEFFSSTKYLAKRNGHSIVTAVKEIKELVDDDYEASPNSSGPTQIKVVPKKIAEKYRVTPETLRKYPQHAAVATMGYLIEALEVLKQKKLNHNLDFITPETYVDYLPYLYRGLGKTVVKGKATPAENGYVIRMKKYMEWVTLYEVPPTR